MSGKVNGPPNAASRANPFQSGTSKLVVYTRSDANLGAEVGQLVCSNGDAAVMVKEEMLSGTFVAVASATKEIALAKGQAG
jgi:hypothetical protein